MTVAVPANVYALCSAAHLAVRFAYTFDGGSLIVARVNNLIPPVYTLT
jgi:hypothetical protein